MKSIVELRALCDALREERSAGRPCALVTILRTSGSTFRRVGAAMLVRDDGSIVNALSGGCPQRDLVERARDVIAAGRPHYVGYNAEHGLDLLLEMGCGGTLDVVIEPVNDDILGFTTLLGRALAARKPFRVLTRFPRPDTDAAVLRQVLPGADGETWSQGDSVESTTTPDGTRVLAESFLPPIRLVAAGASLEAVELVRAAGLLGWQGAIVDTAPERVESVAVPADGWERRVVRSGELQAAGLVDAGTAFVSMTHNLDRDIDYLRSARDGGAFYLGALASRERARQMSDAVASDNLHVPAGLDIGSNTSAEIALAVVAEIMACRHRRGGRALRQMDGPIH